MSTPQTEEYLAARIESCRLLGLNPDDLTAHEAIRADLATVLRLWLDGSQSTLLAGGSADPVKLLSVVEALTKLVPEAEHKSRREDPRDYMWRTYKQMRDRSAAFGQGYDGLKLENEKLRAELVAKDARIAELEAALAGSVPLPPNAVKLSLRNDNPAKVITPPTSDIVPPGEIGKTFVGPQRGPDDPPAKSTQVIDGKAEQPPRPLRIGEQWSPERGFSPIPPHPNAAHTPSPAPAAPPPQATPGYDYDAQPQEWKNYVNSDGSIRSTPRGRWDV
jgi:hypothetical protein